MKMLDNITAIFGIKFSKTLEPFKCNLTLPDKASGRKRKDGAGGDSSGGGGVLDSFKCNVSSKSDEEAAGAAEEGGDTKDDAVVDKEADTERDVTDITGSDMYVEGFISKINANGGGIGRNDNDRQFMFINQRPVDLSKVTRTMNETWRQFEMKNKPAFFLNFVLPTGSVDINVTPDKREVFLTREKEILAILRETVDKNWLPSRGAFVVAETPKPLSAFGFANLALPAATKSPSHDTVATIARKGPSHNTPTSSAVLGAFSSSSASSKTAARGSYAHVPAPAQAPALSAFAASKSSSSSSSAFSYGASQSSIGGGGGPSAIGGSGGGEYSIEPAKSGRSTCKGCKEKIEKDSWRFGSSVAMGNHITTYWKHLECVTTKQLRNVKATLGSLERITGFPTSAAGVEAVCDVFDSVLPDWKHQPEPVLERAPEEGDAAAESETATETENGTATTETENETEMELAPEHENDNDNANDNGSGNEVEYQADLDMGESSASSGSDRGHGRKRKLPGSGGADGDKTYNDVIDGDVAEDQEDGGGNDDGGSDNDEVCVSRSLSHSFYLFCIAYLSVSLFVGEGYHYFISEALAIDIEPSPTWPEPFFLCVHTHH